MSYILDALKKLEAEKERKARGDGMVNIAGELLKNGAVSPKAHRNWPLILGLVLLASFATFGATFLFLHNGTGKRPAASEPLATPAPVASKPSPTVLPVPVAVPPAPRPASLLPPQAAATGTTPSAARPHRAASPALPAAEPTYGENVPPEPSVPAVGALVPPPADIKVSGIAWQDRPAASRTVVNGLLLREGDTVSGARILAIFQNRVRFRSAAGTFEVYLVAAGVPGSPK